MPDDVVGHASVTITPNLDKFREDLKAKLDEAMAQTPDEEVTTKLKGDDTDLKAKTEESNAALDAFSKKEATAKEKADNADALAKTAEATAAIDAFGKKEETAKLGMDTARLREEADKAKEKTDGLRGSFDLLRGHMEVLQGAFGNAATGLSSLGSKASESAGEVGPLVGILATIGPALVPIAGAATGVTLALGGMATAVGASLGAFGLAALPVFKSVSTAMQQISTDQTAISRATTSTAKNSAILRLQTDINNLTPDTAKLVMQVQDAKKGFNDWAASFRPEIMQVFSHALELLNPLLSAMTPLVHGGAKALDEMFGGLKRGIESPAFSQFTKWAGEEAPRALNSLNTFVGGLLAGLGKMFEALTPFIHQVEDGLSHLGTNFDNFAGSQKFKDFVSWLEREGPVVGAALGQLISALEQIIVKLAPYGGVVLKILADALSGIGTALSVINPAVIAAIGVALLTWAVATSPLAAIALALLAIGLAIKAITDAMKPLQGAPFSKLAEANAGLSKPLDQRTAAQKKAISDYNAQGVNDQQIKDAYQAEKVQGPKPGKGLTSTADSALLPTATPQQVAAWKKQQKDIADAAKPPPESGWHTFLRDVGESFVNLGHAIRDVYRFLTTSLPDFFTKTIPHAASVFSGAITGAFQSVHAIFNTTYHAIVNDVFIPLRNFFENTIPHAASVFSGAVTQSFQAVHNIFNTTYHAIVNDVFIPLRNFFENTIPHAADVVKNAVAVAWDYVYQHVHEVWSNLVNDVLDPIRNFFTDTIPNAADTVWHAIVNAWQTVYDVVLGIWNGFKRDVLQPVADFFTITIPNALNTLSSAWSSVWNGLGDIINGAWVHGIQPIINTIIGGINDVISALNLLPGVNIGTLHKLGATDSGANNTVHTGAGVSSSADVGHIPVSKGALGGFINGPTLGFFGEDGPEILLPLSKPERAAELLKQVSIPLPTTSTASGGGGVGHTYSPVYNLTVNGSGLGQGQLANAIRTAMEQHDAHMLQLVGANR